VIAQALASARFLGGYTQVPDRNYGSPLDLSFVMSLTASPSHSQTFSTRQSETNGGLFVKFTFRLSREPIPHRLAASGALVAVRKSQHARNASLTRT
jgi:hypothetical protein